MANSASAWENQHVQLHAQLSEVQAENSAFKAASGQRGDYPAGDCICAQGVYKQMVEVFRSLGVEAVAGVGAPFDPEVFAPHD